MNLYKEYKNNKKVAFYFIYVNEAHPSRNPVVDAKDTGYKGIGRARKLEDRIIAASKCMIGLKMNMTVLIDKMSGVAEKAYSGRPAATCVVDIDGKVRMHSTGPWGTKPKSARKVLEQILPKQKPKKTKAPAKTPEKKKKKTQ